MKPDMPDDDLGEKICAWIEANCRVPEGASGGKPLVLLDWQRNFILKVYDNKATTRRAILSVGRKSGKSTLAAVLLLAHLCGPAAVPNSQLYSTAMSSEQAGLLYSLAAKIVRMSPALSARVVCRDGGKQLTCSQMGTVYKALSSEASTAWALSPVFVVHDELGLVRGPRGELFEALETGSAGSAVVDRHLDASADRR